MGLNMQHKDFFKSGYSYQDYQKSLKRSKICKYTKGEHQFEKVLPGWALNHEQYKHLDPQEFYRAEAKDTNHYSNFFKEKIFVYYRCPCGKKNYHHESRSNYE